MRLRLPNGDFRFTKAHAKCGLIPRSFAGRKRMQNRSGCFSPGGKPPHTGQLFKNPDMAHALRLIAERGPDAFYKGEIAAAILKTSEHLGGTMTAQDLASYSPEWVKPLSIDYRGWRVYELPPNGQGMAALEMLNIMETTPASPLGAFGAPEMHKRIEAMKLAYSDVHAYVADPRTSRYARGAASFERICAETRGRDRSEPRELRSESGRSDRQQYDLSDHGRQRRQYRQLDSEPLFLLRFAGHGGRDGLCPAKSRRELHARSETSERAGGRQAAISHHHSGVHGEGRRAHWIRDHGRRGAADGSRAVCFQLMWITE